MPISLVESIERFDDLKREWDQLSATSRTAHLFNSHDWLNAWWRAFEPTNARLRIYAVRRDGHLIGVLPAMRQGRVIRTLFNHYLGRSDLLLHPDREQEVLRAIFEVLHEERRHWDKVELAQVPEDSVTFRSLEAGVAAPLFVHAVRNIESPYLSTKDQTYDGWYQSRFSGRRRQQDRRKRRQADKIGVVQLHRHVDEALVQEAFRRGVEVEDLSWKGEADSSIKRDDNTLGFMNDVVARFAARGAARLIEMTIAEKTAAFLLGFVHRDTFYFHKTGYDPTFDKVSPGREVLLDAIRLTFDEGLERFDFLGAADEYKLDCSPLVRPHVMAFLFNRGLGSRIEREKKRNAPRVRRVLGRHAQFPVRLDT